MRLARLTRPAERAGHEVSTAHFQAAYPAVAQAGLGARGVYIGSDLHGGSFVYDPWLLYQAGALSIANTVVLGMPDFGKSALTKSWLYRSRVFGRRCEIIDPKGEYEPLVRALDGVVLRLEPGGRTRLNPLTPIGTPELREGLLLAVARAMLARPLSQVEAVGLLAALAAADECSTREVCVGDIVTQLRDPAPRALDALDLSREAARAQLREVALSLMRLCRGPLGGMFDAPSTADSWEAPVICLDVSGVAAGTSGSDLALAITMVCATAFLDAQRTRRVREAERAGVEPQKTIRVNDEAWRALPIAGLGEYYQAAFKLGRQTGVQHWMVLHRLSDLDAAGDAGSRRQALARGLLAETGTVIVYRQHPDELARATAALELSSTESQRVGHYPQGVALWRVGAHSYEVRHVRSARERALTATDAAMAPRALSPLFITATHRVLPSPSPTIYVLLAVLALLAAAALIAARLLSRDRASDRAARFARRRDLHDLHVSATEPGRVSLGCHMGRLVAAERRASVLAVGPSQSGKTSGVVVPALLEWAGPALSTSVKSDVVRETYAARASRGEVLVFDPTGCTGLPHTPWSPLAAAGSWEGARRTAARLLGVGEQAAARSSDDAFWRPAGARFLAPLLLAARQGDLTMRDVLSWVATAEEEPAELLEDCADRGAEAALEALRSVWEADPRFRSNLLQTIATALDPWQEPSIAAATVSDSRISPAWLLGGANTIYLISPAEDQRRLRGLFAALVADVSVGAFERSTATGGPIDPALLLALDEAANVAPLPNLDELASTGPGQGVVLLTVLQNLSQAADRWGSERAQTILANHRARIFCSGIGDQATLDHLRQTLGEREIERISTHRPGSLQPGSRTRTQDFRPLAPPHRVRESQQDEALLVYGRLPPAWLRLRLWWRDPELHALAEGQPPTTPAGAPNSGRQAGPFRQEQGPAWRRVTGVITRSRRTQ